LRTRAPKLRWHEIVEFGRIGECIDSEETMRKVMERCNELFDKDMPWEAETMSEGEQAIPGTKCNVY
jgi:hypothetical protein